MHRGLFLRALGSVSLGFCLLTGTARGQSPAPLASFQFLLGQWEGIGDQAGAAGGFTFAPSVQDRVILRTNYSSTPATAGIDFTYAYDLAGNLIQATDANGVTGTSAAMSHGFMIGSSIASAQPPASNR